MRRSMKTFLSDETGVTLVEYGIALIIAITVGVLGLTTLAGTVSAQVNEANVLLQ